MKFEPGKFYTLDSSGFSRHFVFSRKGVKIPADTPLFCVSLELCSGLEFFGEPVVNFLIDDHVESVVLASTRHWVEFKPKSE
jgi:hypothetical protein